MEVPSHVLGQGLGGITIGRVLRGADGLGPATQHAGRFEIKTGGAPGSCWRWRRLPWGWPSARDARRGRRAGVRRATHGHPHAHGHHQPRRRERPARKPVAALSPIKWGVSWLIDREFRARPYNGARARDWAAWLPS